MIIKNAIDVMEICKKKNIKIYEVGILYEISNTGKSEDELLSKMKHAYDEMKNSIVIGMAGTEKSTITPKMFSNDGKKIIDYMKNTQPFLGNKAATAVAYALSVMEVNCSMGRIVASPTAGSCGVLPAVLLSGIDTLRLDEIHAVNSLFTAGIVGAIIGRNASLSGAQGGCQAEIGSASAMAAATIVELAGGSPKQSFDAAAITLKNVMGLVCDPVAGLVESPCAKRNGMGALNALMAADMVLSGIKSIIPFDEVVWAMDRVGRTMPTTLKETSEGGIAITPTGLKLKKEILE